MMTTELIVSVLAACACVCQSTRRVASAGASESSQALSKGVSLSIITKALLNTHGLTCTSALSIHLDLDTDTTDTVLTFALFPRLST